jgi:hypothetical protein
MKIDKAQSQLSAVAAGGVAQLIGLSLGEKTILFE